MTLSLKPDVAVVDIAMPILDGIGTTKRIKQLHPAITVILMTVLTIRNLCVAHGKRALQGIS